MGSFQERAKRVAPALAFWIVLAGSSAAQDGGFCPQPDLAVPPECWPPPCQGYEPCDPLRSRCPNQDEFFLVPPRPNWYVVADGAAIRRNPVGNFDFASLGLLPTGSAGPVNAVLSTGNFNYDFRAAGRVLIGHTFNECLQIEGIYTGVSEAENSAAVRDATPNVLGGTGNLFSPFGGFGAIPVDNLDYNNFAQIRYTSSLQSFELNIRRQLPMPPERLTASILFGVRYIDLPEDFQYFTQSDMVVNPPPNPPTPGVVANTIHVATSNQMVGPQIGALFEFYVENRWWVNVEMKAALMNNRARQITDYQNVINGTVGAASFSRQEDHTSFAGDLVLTFVYRWSPHVTTRLGYQALWLQDLALAPDNFSTNIEIVRQGPAQLNHNAGTVYHGPFAGIALGW